MSERTFDEALYESLDYGCYQLFYEGMELVEENVKYAAAEFNKLQVRRIRLPDGRGNIVYLMSDSFENSLKMITSKKFLIPPTYRKIFYPQLLFGAFFGRRYRLHLLKERNERVKTIREMTKLIPYATRQLQKTNENVFFSTADLYSVVLPILKRFPIKRGFTEFFKEFDAMLKRLTPDIMKETEDKAWNNRIMIIDAQNFAFKMGAPLEDNKTNPLFLIYLAFLRTKSLATLEVDQDMLITSGNIFLKFNPARVTPQMWSKFRIALFRIMKANLDTYTDELTEEEKEEITVTAEDHLVHNIVDDAITPYTKDVSPETKSVLGEVIDRKIRSAALTNQAISQLTRSEVQAVADEIQPRNKFTSLIKEPKVKSILAPPKPISMNTSTAIGVIKPEEQKGKKISSKRERLYNAIVKDYRPLAQRLAGGEVLDPEEEDLIDQYEDEIRSDVADLLNGDEEVVAEVLDDIQDRTVPLKDLKTAPINSARDQKLREAQKKVVVKNSTIEEILDRDASNVPIKTEDKSKVLKTSNKNMHHVTFANFDKTYINELYMKDIVGCFDMLKDKGSPFHIKSIEVKDTSDTLNLKETWTVRLVDENNKSHTIHVDIPKFYDNRFMLIGGNKYIILKQNFYNPLVKDTPNTVILTTNFNKVTIQRKATKSLSSVERIFSFVKKSGDGKLFTQGDSTKGNLKYVSSLEYDELSRRIFSFKSKSCEIFFSRDYLIEWTGSISEVLKKSAKIKGNEFVIGREGGELLLINEDTGRDRYNRTIAEIIENNLDDQQKAIYQAIKAPKQSMFAEGKLAGQFIPIAVTLIAWVGIRKMLDKMGMKWEFHTDMKRIPKNMDSSRMSYIRFADGILEYEPKTYAELILNGLLKLNPERYSFESFESEESYIDYIYSVWGNYTGILEIKNFYEWLIDHITKDVCRDLMLPTEPDELLIHAVKLLSDNAFVSKANDNSYRVRSVEMIPAILYSEIAKQYKAYVKTGRRLPMTLKPNAVISALQAEKTVDEYSTLNPAIEMGKAHTISTKGYKGSNSEHSYDEEKRSYDPSAVGKIAMSTSADANVGINRELVVEPTLTNARGYRQQVEDKETLLDVNIYSPVEMMTPGAASCEDPIRTAIANKQTQHIVATEDAAPSLVSNGFDEAIQFHLSNDFVINAEEDGKVITIDEEVGFIVVQYNSGKNFAISTKAEVVKNSGGGFFTANQLKPTLTRVGQTFKKDEPLAYHPKYFRHSKMNGLRHTIGPLAKIAFMSTYNTYEDAGICTESLAERMKTSIVYPEIATFKRNANILSMIKIGDRVNIGDSLIKYDTSFEDNEIAKYLTKLSADNKAIFEEETKNEIKAHHAGTVIDIKVYTLLDPSNLSPSLGKVVQQFFNKGIAKKKFLQEYDNSPGIIKAGYLLTDSTEPTVNRYDTIKGKYKGVDVLIEIYVENSDVLGVGDKIALYSANKQIVSEVIPKGYEPYSEFRPEEEISVFTSPGTVARRMTPAVIKISAAMKCLLELKKKIGAEIRYK